MMENKSDTPTQTRITSGLPGLDTLLHGGFIKGGMYLFLGPPGSGKTVLGNQMCFHHAKEHSGNVVYLTLLAESHSRMLQSLREFEYFDKKNVGRSITYLSGYHALEKDGLNGLLLLIAQTVREKNATLLMVDGITTIGDVDRSALAFRRFTHELNAYLASSNCTSFLLSSMEGHSSNPEHTMVDGIICLHNQNVALRAYRQIEVRKFRGSDHMKGKHFFSISDKGLTILPRLEALPPVSHTAPSPSKKRLGFGISGLDEMLGGGLVPNSITTLIGAAGTGKTTIGLHFLKSGAELGEKGLFFGFYESPENLIEKSRSLNLDLSENIKKGEIEILWRPALEQELDELGHSLLQKVQDAKVKRVVIDGVDGFRYSTINSKRINRFFVALIMHLKALGTAVVLIEETALFSKPNHRQVAELSALNESVVFLRHFQSRGKMKRLVSILKVRSSIYDSSIREFKIDAEGVKLLESAASPQSGSQ